MAALGKKHFLTAMVLLLVHLQSNICALESQISDRKLYIVYLGEIPSKVEGDFHTVAAVSHLDMLTSAFESHEAAKEHLAYSYGKSFNGFAAWITPSEAQQLSNMHGVVSVFEDKGKKVMTTRSWDFMGFSETAKRNLRYESDVIVGIMDTGIWPEAASFTDEGFGPIPSKWKGKCQTTLDFKGCNRKVIGATFYNKGNHGDPSREFLSPRDAFAHGSHTASTAAGNVVRNASLLGVAAGHARGGVPGARLAVYKVCWAPYGACSDADILAAFDDAIHDGVDVLSLSIGVDTPAGTFYDAIAIGAFHAMKKGILVSNAAGNCIGFQHVIINFSPWTLTVGASTIDRQYITPLLLGNLLSLDGYSLNTYPMEDPWYPLIYGGDAPNISAGYSSEQSRKCEFYSLDSNKVVGKIVLCDGGSSRAVAVAGGAGIISTSDYFDPESPFVAYPIPETVISTEKANEVKSYINSTSSPLAKILKTVNPHNDVAPILASFSCRGPNPFTPNLLKPDIVAPGVEILAAWSKVVPFLEETVDFNLASGTSMATPHASGAAAYVKSFHPGWSPAAIKSALMTTAIPLNDKLNGNEDAELGYGSGHINPVKAVDPGLVYDADVDSYINFLCSQGYNTTALRLATGDESSCSSNVTKDRDRGARELNYPSMMVVPKPGKPLSATFLRTVTNVGPAESSYSAIITPPSGMIMEVIPNTLTFTSVNQKMSYIVKIEGGGLPAGTMLGGALTWRFSKYRVRSPMVVYCPPHKAKQS